MSPYVGAGLRVATCVGVAYLVLCLPLMLGQAKYVFSPTRVVGLTPAYFDLEFEAVTLRTDDGESLSAWYIPAKGAQWTVLFCHGNGGNIGGRLDTIKTFHDLGMNVMIFDYRGYGESTGVPGERGTYLDVRSAWEYLRDEKELVADKLILFGRSLGGAVAAWQAEQVSPALLVLESTFTSAPDMAAEMFPIMPARLLCKFGYDTLSRVSDLSCPLIIAHGKEDKVVKYGHGRAIYEAAREPKRFIDLDGGHNGGGIDGDAAYQEMVLSMLIL